MEEKKVSSYEVFVSFKNFLEDYDAFRKQNGLNSTLDNIHEVCNCMTDKHGRICREVKHFERNDPKEDWPNGVSEAFMGYLTYFTMVIDKYGIDVAKGFLNELNKSVDQHGK